MSSGSVGLSFLLAAAATVATLSGGIFALRFRKWLRLVLSFSAGALLGVVFFDLMPEALSLTAGNPLAVPVPTVIALGFLAYFAANAFLRARPPRGQGPSTSAGQLGAASLSLHSLLDGMALGLSFQASNSVGLVVAFAIVTHDFSDGINTVGVVLKGQGSTVSARRWLVVDALSPLIGVTLTLFFGLSHMVLGLLLALFAGFFLYIGAVDLLPERLPERRPYGAVGMLTLGMAVIYGAVRLVS